MFYLVFFFTTKESCVITDKHMTDEKRDVESIVNVKYPHGNFKAKILRKACK